MSRIKQKTAESVWILCIVAMQLCLLLL
jgi:hypothetical protein